MYAIGNFKTLWNKKVLGQGPYAVVVRMYSFLL